MRPNPSSPTTIPLSHRQYLILSEQASEGTKGKRSRIPKKKGRLEESPLAEPPDRGSRSRDRTPSPARQITAEINEQGAIMDGISTVTHINPTAAIEATDGDQGATDPLLGWPIPLSPPSPLTRPYPPRTNM